MLFQSKEIPSKNNEMNQLKYISTYKMGQIGITKLIEEPNKRSLNKDMNLPSQQIQINKILSNSNTNTNNTNNTNSNTNSNTYKAIDNFENKKILKNNHSASHTAIHTQSSSNSNYYKKSKNKSNKRINIININKNDKKQKFEAINIDRNQFSKTSNNLYLYLNNNDIYNKNTYKHSLSKNNIKSKTNSKIQSESGFSNYILSSRTPSSIKRSKKKYALSNLINNEKSETNLNLFKREPTSNINIKVKDNKSCKDIKQKHNKKKEELKYETSYQITDFNTYLKVRKREDIQNQKYSNSNIKVESDKFLSSYLFKKEKKNNGYSDLKDNICFSEVLSTENNFREKPNIKLIIEENKKTNRLFTESNQEHNKFDFNLENNNFYKDKNKNSNKKIYDSKTNFYNNKKKNSNKKPSNKNIYDSKTYLQTKKDKNISKINKEENLNKKINMNNDNKNKNNNYKNKKVNKTKKNFSMNNSKKQIFKEVNELKDKSKKDNIRYNSFFKIEKNDNVSKEKKINNKKNDYLNRGMKFECPEEFHFFMVNLTHNCLY